MYKILINAYACCPEMGSEQGMAWNFISRLAAFCELFVITESEYRERNKAAVIPADNGLNTYGLSREQCERIHFCFVDAGETEEDSERIRRMCWNQGDWRFYKYYAEWQKKVVVVAKEIIESQEKEGHGIDVMHQLNMIGFREPGYLWKLSQETGIKFVWGPIGGLKQFPLRYTDGGGLKMKAFMSIKNILNIIQLKYSRRVDAALKQSSALISSIPDSYHAIKKYKGINSVIIPETGCFDVYDYNVSTDRFIKDELNVIWVGKFDFRKRLDIALKSIAETENNKIKISIYGSGSEAQVNTHKKLANQLGIERQVEWKGQQTNNVVKEAMAQSDLFLFTSVSEDTSTVVLEAISNGLPVLCFDICGMGYVIDDSIGMKVKITNTKESVSSFARYLDRVFHNRELLKLMSKNCEAKQRELGWSRKIERLMEVYDEVIKKNRNCMNHGCDGDSDEMKGQKI